MFCQLWSNKREVETKREERWREGEDRREEGRERKEERRRRNRREGKKRGRRGWEGRGRERQILYYVLGNCHKTIASDPQLLTSVSFLSL